MSKYDRSLQDSTVYKINQEKYKYFKNALNNYEVNFKNLQLIPFNDNPAKVNHLISIYDFCINAQNKVGIITEINGDTKKSPYQNGVKLKVSYPIRNNDNNNDIFTLLNTRAEIITIPDIDESNYKIYGNEKKQTHTLTTMSFTESQQSQKCSLLNQNVNFLG